MDQNDEWKCFEKRIEGGNASGCSVARLHQRVDEQASERQDELDIDAVAGSWLPRVASWGLVHTDLQTQLSTLRIVGATT